MDLTIQDDPAFQGMPKIRTLPLDGQALKQLAEAGLTWLKTNQQTVNALNVFPVPDGDTGTNMVLTMQAACNEMAGSNEYNIGKMAHTLAHGALMGARGNSWVILSQVWRGFARALDHLERMDGASLARALAAGRDTAYKGVVRPVEGTILTVAKDIARAAEQVLAETDDPFEMLVRILPYADDSVQHTPELLPVLKEAGVVDSGGKGLFFILEGMVRFIRGLPLDTAVSPVQPLEAMRPDVLEAIAPGQDFEVVIDFRPWSPLNIERFYDDLEKIGTSIQLGEGDGIYRLHIHVPTDRRYIPIDHIMTIGTVTKVALENLLAQMDGSAQQKSDEDKIDLIPIEPGQIAVVVVSPGPGIARVFASLGAAAIVEGGQTMNPSTQEILQAFENLPTGKVLILPNNKNIILAAQAAAQAAAQTTDKKVAIVPSLTIPQGLAAMLRLIPQGDFDAVVAEMTQALADVETGEITSATRSVEIDGVAVEQGQIIGLHNGKLVLAAGTLEDACLGLLGKANAAKRELITLFYGANISRTEVDHIVEVIREAYPTQEIEIQDGGQPHYQFIISVE
jgi:DAK2 domain fusion protein YloV